MRIFYKLFLFVVLGLLFVSCEETTNSENTEIKTLAIEFAPNVYKADGKIVGIDTEIAQRVFESAGLSMDLSIADKWSEAYDKTLNGSNRALLTVGYSQERKDDFKWVGPTGKAIYTIFAMGSSGINEAIGVDASKDIESIAVVEDWLETSTLEDLGFNNLVYFDSYEKAFDAFDKGEVKALAADAFHFVSKASKEYYYQHDIKATCRYKTVSYHIAFSKNTDDEIIESCQNALDKMIENDALLEINQKYIPETTKSNIPGEIQLYTEIAPPFNYYTGSTDFKNHLSGSSVEIVREIIDRNDYNVAIDLTHWTDAYDIIQTHPNSALFTTAKTSERENLFKWAGPIASIDTYFYTLDENNINIESVNDAKALNSIATPRGWYTHEYLINNGFDNIKAETDDVQDAFNLLVNGKAEALLLNDLAVKWQIDNSEVNKNDIKQHILVQSNNGYIAFSKTTPDSTVLQWQSTLDNMINDGTFKDIWQKWYDDKPLPAK